MDCFLFTGPRSEYSWQLQATRIDCISFSRAAKNLEICQTKVTQIGSVLFCRAAKIMELANKSNSN
jgi:hypothetical protein